MSSYREQAIDAINSLNDEYDNEKYRLEGEIENLKSIIIDKDGTIEELGKDYGELFQRYNELVVQRIFEDNLKVLETY